jgi:hypothetical protein
MGMEEDIGLPLMTLTFETLRSRKIRNTCYHRPKVFVFFIILLGRVLLPWWKSKNTDLRFKHDESHNSKYNVNGKNK